MIAIFLLLSLRGFDEPKPVDIAEINVVYDRHGKLKFTQVVLWRWGRFPDGHAHHVAQWFMIHDEGCWSVRRRGTRHVLEFRTRDGQVRRVSARSFREPRPTTIDHEVRDQKKLPASCRKPYFK